MECLTFELICVKRSFKFIFITQQELQYAQRYQEPQGGAESSYSEPEEQRPPSILKNRVRLRECKSLSSVSQLSNRHLQYNFNG